MQLHLIGAQDFWERGGLEFSIQKMWSFPSDRQLYFSVQDKVYGRKTCNCRSGRNPKCFLWLLFLEFSIVLITRLYFSRGSVSAISQECPTSDSALYYKHAKPYWLDAFKKKGDWLWCGLLSKQSKEEHWIGMVTPTSSKSWSFLFCPACPLQTGSMLTVLAGSNFIRRGTWLVGRQNLRHSEEKAKAYRTMASW